MDLISGEGGGRCDTDNVVVLPNLLSGRLAEVLAAAAGPAQEHELCGERDAKVMFAAVCSSDAWATPRRRVRRTPAVLAVTAVATMMVATTGLAAATDLPARAGRAVQGIFASSGVTAPQPVPVPATVGPDGSAGASRTHTSPVGSAVVGTAQSACATGVAASARPGIQMTSCRRQSTSHAVGVATAPPVTSPAPAATAAAAPHQFHTSTGPRAATTASSLLKNTGKKTHQGATHGAGSPGTLPGGGTSRGGNQGTGPGTCTTGGPASGNPTPTPTTTPAPSTATPATGPSSATPTTSTTDPATVPPGCTHGTGKHHRQGGGAGTTTTTTPTLGA